MNAVFSEISNCLYTWADVATIDKGLTPSSPDAALNARGLFRLPAPAAPTPGAYQFVVEGLPVKKKGAYQRTYTVVDMFPAPAEDWETGETLSVQEQKGRYDAQIAAQAQAVKDAQTLHPRQARQALIDMGLDEKVEAVIDSIKDEKQRKTVRNWYEYSTLWIYGNPVLTQFAGALNIDKDEFFALASTL